MNNNYYNTRETVDEYIKMADGINGAQLIKKLNSFLKNEAALLELGSGPGSDFQILKQSYHVVGSDFSKEFLSRLIKNNPDDKFLNLDAKTLKTERKFDGIYSNKVLHHLNDLDLKSSVQRQAEILNLGGIICHSFWKGEGEEVFNGLFVNYQNSESLKRLFEEYFELLLIEEYQEFDDGDSLLLIARKK